VVDHAVGSPFHVDASVAEFLKGVGIGFVAVECGIENDLGVHAPVVSINERGDCSWIGESYMVMRTEWAAPLMRPILAE
jgi:hypothetical protein